MQSDNSNKSLINRLFDDPKPASIVSLSQHRNIIFNEQLLKLTGQSAEYLREKQLILSWWRKGEENPFKIARGEIPSQLDRMLRDLRQQSKIESFHYEGWNEEEYGFFTIDIEVVEYMGEMCRYTRTQDWKPGLKKMPVV